MLFLLVVQTNLNWSIILAIGEDRPVFVYMKETNQETPITKYNLQELTWRDFLRVFMPLIIIVLVPLGYGLWRTIYGYSSFGPAAAAAWGKTWFFISGILVIFLLLYTYRRLKRAHTWINVYTWGLKFHFPPGRQRILKWNEIVGITSYSINKSFLRSVRRKKHYMFLYSERYRPLQVHPGIKDHEGLKKIIKKHTYKRLQPRLSQAFLKGKTLPFGDVSISKEKLILPKVEVPWDYIEGISVEKGVFIINLTEKNTIEIPIRKIINLEILIHLIKTEI